MRGTVGLGILIDGKLRVLEGRRRLGGHSTAYSTSGAADSRYNGLYVQTTQACNNRPVYQKGGSDCFVLLSATWSSGSLRSDWTVSDSDHAMSCENTGYLSSSGNGGVCPDSPDGAGCAGKWEEADSNQHWGPNPSFAVVASQGR